MNDNDKQQQSILIKLFSSPYIQLFLPPPPHFLKNQLLLIYLLTNKTESWSDQGPVSQSILRTKLYFRKELFSKLITYPFHYSSLMKFLSYVLTLRHVNRCLKLNMATVYVILKWIISCTKILEYTYC